MAEIQASFLYPFSYALLGEGDTFLESFLGSFWGFVCRQPLPANPFSEPLKTGEQAENIGRTGIFSLWQFVRDAVVFWLFFAVAGRCPRSNP